MKFRNIGNPHWFEYFPKKIGKYLLFFLVFILSGCHSSSSLLMKDLTFEERKDLECFFNLLFFEEAGAFVAVGSKPMCSASILDIDAFYNLQQEELAAMNEEERIAFQKTSEELSKRGILPEICFTGNPYKGFLALKKLLSTIDHQKYLITLQPQGESFFYPLGSAHPEGQICAYDLIFASVPKTAAILAEHYSIFREIIGTDFDPFSIVFELENPDSVFWRQVFQMKEHIAKGLLFGFGKKNAALFDAQARHFGKDDPFSRTISDLDLPRSTKNPKKTIGAQNCENFSIPFFLSIDSNVVDLYKKEKLEIQKYYKNGNVVSKSLELLRASEKR